MNVLQQKHSTPSLSHLSRATRKEVMALRERYSTLNKFMEDNTPKKQIELCHNPEQCIFGSSPTLIKLNYAFGNFSAEKWLIPQIVEVSLVLGLKEEVTVEQTRFVASAIAALYYWLKTDELMLFFFKFKAGSYERFYGRFDPQILIQSIKAFLFERKCYYQHNSPKK